MTLWCFGYRSRIENGRMRELCLLVERDGCQGCARIHTPRAGGCRCVIAGCEPPSPKDAPTTNVGFECGFGNEDLLEGVAPKSQARTTRSGTVLTVMWASLDSAARMVKVRLPHENK